MPKSTGSRYTEEFKAEAGQLTRSSPERPIRQLAYELGISDQTLRILKKLRPSSQRKTGLGEHVSAHGGGEGYLLRPYAVQAT